ncbi:hypothetical protein F2P81_001223 [Scophthalmus maximus]|uniref:Uncharacterized protein n=1 Tax=Scophthalmus maximus TaxID=52904 RepID=A0A6A4TV91_SCOMX|nr:hypothetical protein F2P81_001223 [Scophthalmus maximus]
MSAEMRFIIDMEHHLHSPRIDSYMAYAINRTTAGGLLLLLTTDVRQSGTTDGNNVARFSSYLHGTDSQTQSKNPVSIGLHYLHLQLSMTSPSPTLNMRRPASMTLFWCQTEDWPYVITLKAKRVHD